MLEHIYLLKSYAYPFSFNIDTDIDQLFSEFVYQVNPTYVYIITTKTGFEALAIVPDLIFSPFKSKTSYET